VRVHELISEEVLEPRYEASSGSLIGRQLHAPPRTLLSTARLSPAEGERGATTGSPARPTLRPEERI
jgi:hypothetical protein